MSRQGVVDLMLEMAKGYTFVVADTLRKSRRSQPGSPGQAVFKAERRLILPWYLRPTVLSRALGRADQMDATDMTLLAAKHDVGLLLVDHHRKAAHMYADPVDDIIGSTAKYVGPAGWANGLFNADRLACGKPVMLVEGEFDAMVVQQEAAALVAAVANGSTSGSRRAQWLSKLALAGWVSVSYDVDRNGAGDRAAEWWLRMLPNAVRWRPPWGDISAMALFQIEIRDWITTGLTSFGNYPQTGEVNVKVLSSHHNAGAIIDLKSCCGRSGI